MTRGGKRSGAGAHRRRFTLSKQAATALREATQKRVGRQDVTDEELELTLGEIVMARYDVTAEIESTTTFSEIAARYQRAGVVIDHFHVVEVVDGREYVFHVNSDGEGGWVEDWKDRTNDIIIGDRVIADEWHERS